MKAWTHSGFNVYAAEAIRADDENARLFLGRYLKKAPVAQNRISIEESALEQTVVIQKPGDDQAETRSFSPLSFLAELSLYIPNTWEQTSRMFGCYSSSARGKVAREERFRTLIENNFQPLSVPEEKPVRSESFA